MMSIGLMAAIPLMASAAEDDEIITSVSVFVTPPIAGEHPDFTPISGDPDKYTVSVYYWYIFESGIGDDAIRLTSTDTYVAGQAYAVRIWFYANEGYIFDTFANGLWATFSGGNTHDIWSGNNYPNTMALFEGHYFATCIHDYEVSSVINPTCEEQGYTIYTCSICGDEYAGSYTPALGHDWGEWVITTPATCGANGVETRVCGNDLAPIQTRVIPAMGHNYVPMSVTTSSTNLQDKTTVTITVYGVCANCGETIVLASQSVKLKQNGTQTVKIGDYDVVVVVNGNNKITSIYLGSPTGSGNQNNQGQNGNGNKQ